MKKFFRQYILRVKDFSINLIFRLKPRRQIRWLLTFFLWLALFAYIGNGIYFGFIIYKWQSEQELAPIDDMFAGNSAQFQWVPKIYPYPAAFVGGNIIWVKDYYEQLAYIKHFSEKTKQPLPDKTVLRKQIMDQLIENRLLNWQAAKNSINVSNQDVDDAYQKIVDESGGQLEVQKVLNELWGMNEKSLKKSLKEQVTKEKIQNELIAQIKVLHILIKDEARANEVAIKVKNGEPWDQLAKTYSEDLNTRDSWGALGWISKGNLVIDNKQVPEFEDAAFKAKVGEVFGPVKTQVGFQIGKVEEKKGKIQESYSNWLDQIKKNTKIYTFIK